MQTARRKTSTRRLREQVSSGTRRVDRVAGVIRGVKVLGAHSQNGYRYSNEALEGAVQLFEGIRVYVDHVEKDDPYRDRRISEQFGVLKNVRKRGNALYADLHYLQSHPQSEQILESAERFPDKFGLSPYTAGKVNNARKEVVEIIDAMSVDIVSEPATTVGLFESRRTEAMLREKLLELIDEELTDAEFRSRVEELLEESDVEAEVENVVESRRRRRGEYPATRAGFRRALTR